MATMSVDIGKDLTIEVDVDRIRSFANVDEYVYYKGLRNILMDTHSSVKKEDYDEDDLATWRADSLAMSLAKLETMYKGESNASVGTVRTTDPIRRKALDLAQDRLKIRWEKEHGKKVPMPTPRKAASEYLAKHPELMDLAKTLYEADVAAALEGDIELPEPKPPAESVKTRKPKKVKK